MSNSYFYLIKYTIMDGNYKYPHQEIFSCEFKSIRMVRHKIALWYQPLDHRRLVINKVKPLNTSEAERLFKLFYF